MPARAAPKVAGDECRGHSSAGRALQWHCRGQRFDPAWLHQNSQRVRGFALRTLCCFEVQLECYRGVRERGVERRGPTLLAVRMQMAVMPLDHSDVGVTEKRSEEHTSELQSLMRTSYAVFCLKKNKNKSRL